MDDLVSDESGDGKEKGTVNMDDDSDDSIADDEDGAMQFSGEEGVSVDLEEAGNKPLDPKALAERKRAKRLEKLDKRIKLLQKKKDKEKPRKSTKFERETKDILNKHKRQEVVLRRRMAALQALSRAQQLRAEHP